MSTLEQLPADRRAIIELILRRGQSYADLAETLQMPEARVRRYAREALASLSPQAADRVESEWLGQVADYLLGQQGGPQAKATRAHLRRSEPARDWALSTVTSLGDLYREGEEPEIPGTDGAVGPESAAAREAGPTRTSGRGDGAPAGGRGRSHRAQRGERTGGERTGGEAARRERRGGKAPEPAGRPRRRLRATSAAASSTGARPEAQAAVRRRRTLGAALAALVAAAAIVGVLFATGVLGGDEPDDAAAGGDEAAPASEQAPELLGQVQLRPVGGGDGAGVASIGTQAGEPFVVVQARLDPTDRDEVYVLWAYNDRNDAVPIGAIQTDEQGNLQGAGPLPPDYERYQSVDISLQESRGSAEHSGDSVLRGSLEELQPPE